MNRLKFEAFELDTHQFALFEGDRQLGIGRRGFDLLHYLIRHRERIVPTSELLREVWGAQALSPSAIPTCLLELRKCIGDTSPPYRVIRTIRGRGYQFVADLDLPEQSEYFAETRPSEPRFVGRVQELNEILQEADAAALNRRLALILIRGGAGMGKTRLLQEFLRAAPSSLGTFVVRCPEMDGVPPFRPWQLLWNQLARRSRSEEGSRLDDGQLPDGIAIRESKALGAPWDKVADRFSLFDAWSTLLRRLANEKPFVVVMEDLHRTDVDSVELLRWMAHDLANAPLLLACSFRPVANDHDLSRALSRLSNDASSTTITLSPLNVDCVRQLITDHVCEAHSVAHQLHRQTAGVPFYLQRVLQEILRVSDDNRSNVDLPDLPLSSEEILAHQIGDLPAPTRRSLEVACVFGNSFPLACASTVARCDRSTFLERVEPARRLGLVCEALENPDSMQFTHTILRDALYDSLPTEKRKQIHARIGNVIASHSGERLCDTAGIIADHLARAVPVADPMKVAKYSRIAGRQCLERFAFSDALAHFRKVLKIVEDNSTSSPKERCRARFDLAEAQTYSGDRDSARRILLEAAGIARQADLAELIAESALRISPDYLSIEVGPHDPELVDLLFETLERLPPDDPSLRAQVMARLSLALAWSGSPEQRGRFALEAVSLARRMNDPVALGAALAARSDSLHGPDRVTERLQTNAELRQAVRRTQDRPGRILHHIRQIAALLDSGDIQGVDVEIAACDASVLEMNVPQYSWYPIAYRAMRRIMAGDLDHAGKLGDEFLAIGKRSGDSNVGASRACQLCTVLIERAQSSLAAPYGEELVSRHSNVRAWSAGLGYVYLNSGNPGKAADVLNTFDSNDIRRLLHETAGSAGVAFLAEVAITAGDTARTAQIYDLISSLGKRSATLGFGIGYFGCFARYAGLLASKLGLDSEAVEHLCEAVSIESHRSADLWRTHAEIDLAVVLCTLGGREADVTNLLQSAASRAQKLGLKRAHHRYKVAARDIF